jgi:hypothetical protein
MFRILTLYAMSSIKPAVNRILEVVREDKRASSYFPTSTLQAESGGIYFWNDENSQSMRRQILKDSSQLDNVWAPVYDLH